MTFARAFANRGFMPGELIYGARDDMIKAVTDADTVGSAMLTGIAIEVFRDLNDAAGHMVEEIHTYEPRQDMHDKYMKIYERYEKVYQAVRPLV